MITLTETAAGKVKELLAEEGRDDIALRVAVQPGGCSGLRYAMYLDDQFGEKDQTEEQFGVRLVIDKMSVPVPLTGHDRLRRHPGADGLHDRQPGRPGRLRLRQLVPLTVVLVVRSIRPFVRASLVRGGRVEAGAEPVGDLGDVAPRRSRAAARRRAPRRRAAGPGCRPRGMPCRRAPAATGRRRRGPAAGCTAASSPTPPRTSSTSSWSASGRSASDSGVSSFKRPFAQVLALHDVEVREAAAATVAWPLYV